MVGQSLRKASRYSLRSLLVLMTLCCVAMWIWTLYVQPFRVQAASIKRVNELGGASVSVEAQGSEWHQWLVETMVGPKQFVEVQGVDLRDRPVKVSDVSALSGLRHLRWLHLDRAEVSDANVSVLSNMAELEQLSLTYTQISDEGLTQVGRLAKLKILYLTGVPVSDKSIGLLAQLPSLQTLYIRWTNISADGVEQLRKALPNCAVHHHEIQRAIAAPAMPETSNVGLASNEEGDAGGE
jgi:hypothetical protein